MRFLSEALGLKFGVLGGSLRRRPGALGLNSEALNLNFSILNPISS